MQSAVVFCLAASAVAGASSIAAASAASTRHRVIGEPVTKKFEFTGTVQTLDVPAGVKKVEITAVGAAGGSGSNGNKWFGGPGGTGTMVRANIPLSGAQVTLRILVGGKGEHGDLFRAGDGGWNGGGSGASAGGAGGGGGASEVRTSDAIGSRIIVAGGGGGGGASGSEGPGGHGGPTAGGSLNGADGHSDPIDFFTCHGRGGGGGGSNGGGYGGNSPCAGDGIGGRLLVGGRGGISVLGEGGGGGGGGYYGGGGGGGAGGGSGAGGGAGSSYVAPGATVVAQAFSTERPSVEISYTIPAPVITCTSPIVLKIGQSLDDLLNVCRTDVFDGDIGVEGPAPAGTLFFIGPEVADGPLVLVVGTFPGGKVRGPARDYEITVKASNAGGPSATAHVTFKVTD